MVHLGGLFRLLQCVNDGRSFCLLERFRVDEWIDAVRRHRPRTVSLVPAALRMVLDADLDRADFASVRSVISGTAPLAPAPASHPVQRLVGSGPVKPRRCVRRACRMEQIVDMKTSCTSRPLTAFARVIARPHFWCALPLPGKACRRAIVPGALPKNEYGRGVTVTRLRGCQR